MTITRSRLVALVAAVSLLGPVTAGATSVGVGELGDTRDTAFDLDPFFSLPPPADSLAGPGQRTATVLSGIDTPLDVDWYSFTARAGASVLLDIDDANPFDTILSLFDSAGTLLANDDDSDSEPGSPGEFDPYIGAFIAPATDTYFVAVSSNANFPDVIFDPGCAATDELRRPDGSTGGDLLDCPVGIDTFGNEGQSGSAPGTYTLHVSVPEPDAGLLVCGGLLVLAARARRRGRRRVSPSPACAASVGR